MNNGGDGLDEIKSILKDVAQSQKKLAESQNRLNASQDRLTANQDRLNASQSQFGEAFNKTMERVGKRLDEMAARQQYHDEAFERFDAEMKVIRDAISADAENIRALARIAELHHQRLERLEGGEPI